MNAAEHQTIKCPCSSVSRSLSVDDSNSLLFIALLFLFSVGLGFLASRLLFISARSLAPLPAYLLLFLLLLLLLFHLRLHLVQFISFNSHRERAIWEKVKRMSCEICCLQSLILSFDAVCSVVLYFLFCFVFRSVSFASCDKHTY